jgi:probable rRNA maturation factor
MILLDNQTNQDININLLENIAKYLNISKDIELVITTNTQIERLNKEHRGISKATDVLSFPLQDLEFMPIGSIVISAEYAKSATTKFNHSIKDEITLLFIHGLLHLIGYDHEVDNGEMRAKEKEIVEHFKLPTSLIVRVEGEQ